MRAYYAATDHYEAWDVALVIAEVVCPGFRRFTILASANRLFRHLRDENNPSGITDAQLILWLHGADGAGREYDQI